MKQSKTIVRMMTTNQTEIGGDTKSAGRPLHRDRRKGDRWRESERGTHTDTHTHTHTHTQPEQKRYKINKIDVLILNSRE